MGQTIKIKRSTGNGKPTNVAQGELFYAYGTGGTFGKMLSIGHVDGGGNTPEIIGGKHFIDMLDHTAGTLTASSAIIADSAKAIDQLRIKNQGELQLYETTATGVHYTGLKAVSNLTGTQVYTLPEAAINGRFLQTNASGGLSWQPISATLTIGGDSGGNDNVTIGTDTFNIIGTANEVETSVSNNTITVGLPANVTISGNLTVSGTTTTVSSTTVNVADSMLSLATGNGTQDVIDIGFYGLYDTSGSQDLYSGFFRDANDSGKWKLFKDNQAAPTTTVNTSGTGYSVATLVANLESAAVAITGGSITGITDLAVADGGTGLSAVAKGSVLVANSANTLTAVDGGGSTDKMLLYTASSDTISWSNAIDGGTYS